MMYQITLKIDGMSCGMCEAHINDVIRQKFPVKKVTSSHKTGITEILAEAEPDRAALEKAIADTGYTLVSVESVPYIKKKLFAK